MNWFLRENVRRLTISINPPNSIGFITPWWYLLYLRHLNWYFKRYPLVIPYAFVMDFLCFVEGLGVFHRYWINFHEIVIDKIFCLPSKSSPWPVGDRISRPFFQWPKKRKKLIKKDDWYVKKKVVSKSSQKIEGHEQYTMRVRGNKSFNY